MNKKMIIIFTVTVLILAIIVLGFLWLKNKKVSNINLVSSNNNSELKSTVDNSSVNSSTEKIKIELTTSDTTDSDNDGLVDSQEIIWGTDVHKPDTNGDGINDGDSLKQGINPLTGKPLKK